MTKKCLSRNQTISLFSSFCFTALQHVIFDSIRENNRAIISFFPRSLSSLIQTLVGFRKKIQSAMHYSVWPILIQVDEEILLETVVRIADHKRITKQVVYIIDP